MGTESQSAFAERMDVNKSTVSRWKNSGRLVMSGRKVDVEASIDLIKSTSGSRDDVAARHDSEREIKSFLDAKADAVDIDKDNDGDQEKIRTQLRSAALRKALGDARIKQAEADIREMERDQKAGSLVSMDDVDYVLSDVGLLFRLMFDSRAERMGAELGLTPHQVVGLSESDDQLLTEISEKLKDKGRIQS